MFYCFASIRHFFPCMDLNPGGVVQIKTTHEDSHHLSKLTQQ